MSEHYLRAAMEAINYANEAADRARAVSFHGARPNYCRAFDLVQAARDYLLTKAMLHTFVTTIGFAENHRSPALMPPLLDYPDLRPYSYLIIGTEADGTPGPDAVVCDPIAEIYCMDDEFEAEWQRVMRELVASDNELFCDLIPSQSQFEPPSYFSIPCDHPKVYELHSGRFQAVVLNTQYSAPWLKPRRSTPGPNLPYVPSSRVPASPSQSSSSLPLNTVQRPLRRLPRSARAAFKSLPLRNQIAHTRVLDAQALQYGDPLSRQAQRRRSQALKELQEKIFRQRQLAAKNRQPIRILGSAEE